MTRAAYGTALPVKDGSRRYATARRAALDREPPRPLQGQNTGQGTPCPQRDALDNRRPPEPVATTEDETRTTSQATIQYQDPKLAQNCYTDGIKTARLRRAARTRYGLRPRAHAHQHQANMITNEQAGSASQTNRP